MLVNADRRRALAIAALLLTVVVVGVASAQEANETEADLADKEDAGSVVLLLGLVCGLPFFLLALFGIVWTVAYPVMLVWAILFSSKKLDQQIADTTSRPLTAVIAVTSPQAGLCGPESSSDPVTGIS